MKYLIIWFILCTGCIQEKPTVSDSNVPPLIKRTPPFEPSVAVPETLWNTLTVNEVVWETDLCECNCSCCDYSVTTAEVWYDN